MHLDLHIAINFLLLHLLLAQTASGLQHTFIFFSVCLFPLANSASTTGSQATAEDGALRDGEGGGGAAQQQNEHLPLLISRIEANDEPGVR